MVKCFVKGCKEGNNGGRLTPGISIHRFPSKCLETRQKWIEAMNLTRLGWNPTPNSRVCSRHFHPVHDFKMTGKKIRILKRGAVPSFLEPPHFNNHPSPTVTVVSERNKIDESMRDVINPNCFNHIISKICHHVVAKL